MDLGQRETGIGQIGDFGEKREIAAGGLDAAFDHVAGDHGTGQLVIVGPVPAEMRGRRRDGHRCVGDPAGHDDVGATVEAVDDAPGAQVGVGRQRRAQSQLLGAGRQVVAVDVGDAGRYAQALGQGAHRIGQAGGVQAAGVGDDAYAAVVCQPEALLELGQEGLGVAAFGVLHPVAAEDQHGQLGQVVTGEVIQVAAGEHLAHRGVPVAVEPRAVPDPDWARRNRRRSHALSSSLQPPAGRTNQPVG